MSKSWSNFWLNNLEKKENEEHLKAICKKAGIPFIDFIKMSTDEQNKIIKISSSRKTRSN